MEIKTKLWSIIHLVISGIKKDENTDFFLSVAAAVIAVIETEKDRFPKEVNLSSINPEYVHAKQNMLLIDLEKIQDSLERVRFGNVQGYLSVAELYEKYYYDVNTYLLFNKL